VTDALPPAVNPFRLAGWGPLCPWRHPAHKDRYVSVDHTDAQYEEFTRQMKDLTTLKEYGRLVLVTGESGCGKSALVNRCAEWVHGHDPERCVIVDLSTVLAGRPELSIDDRMSVVCDRLFGELRSRGVLRPDALADLAADRDQPDRIYPDLARALHEDIVLIVLLPSPHELQNEVVRYASYVRARVLFLVESALLDPAAVAEIVETVKDGVPPITLRVGPLVEGDVWRFAEDRFNASAENGRYPRMSEETAKSVEPLLRTVAQLQRELEHLWEGKRCSGLEYDERCSVTADEIRRQFHKRLGASHERS
jgi:hypothetical protein